MISWSFVWFLLCVYNLQSGMDDAAVAVAAAPGKDNLGKLERMRLFVCLCFSSLLFLVMKPKKKNLCNLFVETGACSWGANCKYSHDTTKRNLISPK